MKTVTVEVTACEAQQCLQQACDFCEICAAGPFCWEHLSVIQLGLSLYSGSPTLRLCRACAARADAQECAIAFRKCIDAFNAAVAAFSKVPGKRNPVSPVFHFKPHNWPVPADGADGSQAASPEAKKE